MDESEWNVAVCGLNCAKCGLFKASKCSGCRGPSQHHWSPDCALMLCAHQKGLGYCFQCEQFPCQHILAFAEDGYPNHRASVENLKRMKMVGLQTWTREQPEVLFCPGYSQPGTKPG